MAPAALPRISLANLTDDGLFYIAPDGSRWGPLTCSDHAATKADGSPNPPGQVGFKRNCAACIATVMGLLEHFNLVQDTNDRAARGQEHRT